MRCPHCHSLEDKVVESRTLASGDAIRRRRECIECGYRFTSYERIEEKQLMVIKRTGDRREPFSREKLERGVQRALEKRPFSQIEIENVINELEDEAVMKGRSTHEITSRELGEMVLKELYRADKVAYIRFASVYRNFEGVEEFVREIETLAGLRSEASDRKDSEKET
jgi:transcriptional repressor NrdR